MTGNLEQLAQATLEGDRHALRALVEALQDDLFRLSFRMLGLRPDAEDATQEILVKVVTHLSTFRAESSLRTWAWRIGVRHLMRARKTKREEAASFENIEMLIERGNANPPMPDLEGPEIALLAEEVRLSCTEAMVLSLERDHRIAWILTEVFELSSDDAAAVVEIAPAAFRKRVSRAREKLGSWMSGKCGLVAPKNACRCERQIPVAMQFGVVTRGAPEYAGHSEPVEKRRRLAIAAEATAIEAAAEALTDHPD